jgi:hypothetical protein
VQKTIHRQDARDGLDALMTLRHVGRRHSQDHQGARNRSVGVGSMDVWQRVVIDSLEFHPGPLWSKYKVLFIVHILQKIGSPWV